MRSVGLDLGSREVSFCEVSNGTILGRRTARDLGGLEELLGPASAPARVVIEACREAWHVHDVLRSWGHEVVMVDTTKSRRMGIGQHGRKNDRIDAEVLARALERGSIPVAHVLSPARRELREKLLARRALVESRAQMVTTVRGILRARGQVLGGCDTENFRAKMQKTALGSEAREAVSALLQVLETLDTQLSKLETTLEKMCEKEPTIAQLTTAPGVGLIVAAAFVSVVDEAKRFRNAHALESYLGLVPSESTSGGRDKRRLGAITKCGNPYLRALLVQASWSIMRSRADDPLHIWAHQVSKRRGKRIAVVALARRLAGVLWAMWRHGQVYDPALVGFATLRGQHRALASAAANARAMAAVARKAKHRQRVIDARPSAANAHATAVVARKAKHHQRVIDARPSEVATKN